MKVKKFEPILEITEKELVDQIAGYLQSIDYRKEGTPFGIDTAIANKIFKEK